MGCDDFWIEECRSGYFWPTILEDCFAWEYFEMPGLDRSIVEHRFPIKPGYRPFKQALRRFNPNVLDDIKKDS